jgi:hypothetical protein
MDDTQSNCDAAVICADGESEPAGLRLARRKRRRIGGAVDPQGNDVGTGIAAGDVRCKGASIGQCHFRVANVGESLLRGHDDVFAPERSGTHPVPRDGDTCNQRPREPHALCQRIGQIDQRVFSNIGHDLFSYST